MRLSNASGLILRVQNKIFFSMAFSLAACGSSGGDDKDADKGGDEKTLKVAAVETAYGADMWKEVCSAFEKSHEGVKVELTIDKKLEDVINPQMKSGEYPDVHRMSIERIGRDSLVSCRWAILWRRALPRRPSTEFPTNRTGAQEESAR